MNMPNLAQPVRLLAAVAILAGLLISGCRGPQTPDPSMTAVRGSGADSADWISPEDVARAESLGLSTRDSDMLLGQGNRIENLFSPVYFDFDQSFIRPADRGTLQQVASHLSENPADQLLVEGHCDWRGTTEYNMALGDRRANSVVAYLEQLGVSPDRLETVSKGDLEAVTEGTEEQMRLDRRADLVIVR
ncbi:MAG: OmpA family protein [Oceanipulchritudo sp.]